MQQYNVFISTILLQLIINPKRTLQCEEQNLKYLSKMIGKIAIVAVFVTLAVSVQGHSLHNSVHNVNVAPMYIEERTVAAPLSLGALILKGAKLVGFLIKSAWSVGGFKVGAIALVANLLIWGIKHGFIIILGGLGMLGFCKFTGKCNAIYLPKPVLDIGDSLLYAARQLQNGAELYENEILY